MGSAWTASCGRCGTTRNIPCPRRWACLPCRSPAPQAWRRRLARSPSPGSRWRLSTTFNPLIGGLFSLIYGAVVLPTHCARVEWRALLRHAIAAALVGVAVMWCVTNDMVEGAADVVIYGFGGLRAQRADRDDGSVARPRCSFRRCSLCGRRQSFRGTCGPASRA